MIIECIKCAKKFEVNSDLIPEKGRTIQCGSCNYTWYFKKSDEIFTQTKKEESQIEFPETDNVNTSKENKINKSKKVVKKTNTELIKYQKKTSFTLGKFLSFIFVSFISFVALILIIDTFKMQIFRIFPGLDNLLFSLYEILKDIQLFIKDLI